MLCEIASTIRVHSRLAQWKSAALITRRRWGQYPRLLLLHDLVSRLYSTEAAQGRVKKPLTPEGKHKSCNAQHHAPSPVGSRQKETVGMSAGSTPAGAPQAASKMVKCTCLIYSICAGSSPAPPTAPHVNCPIPQKHRCFYMLP